MTMHPTSESRLGVTPGPVPGVRERTMLSAVSLEVGSRRRPSLDVEVPVARVMTRDPVTIDAGASLEDAHERMLRACVHHLPVLSEGRLVDVITDRDLAAYRSFGPGFGPTTVGEILTGSPPCVCAPQTPLEVVARCLLVTRANAAVVVDERERVVGIFTSVDALRFVGGLPPA